MSKKYRKINNLYNKTIITKKINRPMRNITTIINKTEDLKKYMEQVIDKEISDKCIVEGYIKPNSITVLSHSNGIQENQSIKFQVVFECLVCNPSEGQHINCVAKNITKAGIRAEVDDEHNPLIIFVARDHNYLNKLFSNIKNEQQIVVRIIGSRFELNDVKISLVGEIVKSSKLVKLSVSKPYEDINIPIANDEDVLEDDIAELEDDIAELEDDVAELEEDALDEADEDVLDEADEDALDEADEDALDEADEDVLDEGEEDTIDEGDEVVK
jgi:DNA-directed RNA polymerase subunit E'/Rpb7